MVLEVMRPWLMETPTSWLTRSLMTVREIHKDHPTEALQAQQLRQFCTPTEQVRLPQGSPKQRGKRPVAIRAKCRLPMLKVEGNLSHTEQAWEFKHPEFRANSKESLDNIRRKAPAPRKQTQNNDDSVPTQQIDLLNQQIVAQQQQIQHLSDRYAQLTVDHQLMLQEVMRVQKTVLNHENVIHQVMAHLLHGGSPAPATARPCPSRPEQP